jgi:hypothetical protein
MEDVEPKKIQEACAERVRSGRAKWARKASHPYDVDGRAGSSREGTDERAGSGLAGSKEDREPELLPRSLLLPPRSSIRLGGRPGGLPRLIATTEGAARTVHRTSGLAGEPPLLAPEQQGEGRQGGVLLSYITRLGGGVLRSSRRQRLRTQVCIF